MTRPFAAFEPGLVSEQEAVGSKQATKSRLMARLGMTCAPRRKKQRVQEPWFPGQTISRNSRNNPAAISIATGSVRIQARAMLLMVDICRPDLSAAIVPATPEEST